MLRTGAKHTSLPSMIRHHSSRVLVRKMAPSRCFIAGHEGRSFCSGSFSPLSPDRRINSS